MKIGSLFSGAGGLDLAVEAAFNATTAWHCEVNAAASKVLAARWPHTPNLGDITTVDWTHVEPVDILCGGFPCQDVSAAGRRAGIKDGTRSGLWAIFADAINVLKPQYVVIENVRGLLNATAHRPMEPQPDALGDRDTQPVLRAIGAVLGDLSDLRYDAQWSTVAAAHVGAPHRRERVFIVATPTDASRHRLYGDRPQSRISGRRLEGQSYSDCRDAAVRSDGPVELLPTPDAGNFNDGEDLDNWHARRQRRNGFGMPLSIAVRMLPTPTSRDGKGHNQRRDETCLTGALLPTPTQADWGRGSVHPDRRKELNPKHSPELHELARHVADWGKYAPAIHRWETATRPAPPPTEPNTKGNPRLNPAFSEWMMGWPHGWVTQVPGISRNDALRIIGNGVVPQAAHHAIQTLLNVAEVVA